MSSRPRYAGVIIVLGASLGAAAGLLAGQIASTVAIGIAMAGILIGSALARGDFHRARPLASPAAPPTTNEQRFSGKE